MRSGLGSCSGLNKDDKRYSPIRSYYCSLVKRREKWAEQKKEEEKRKPDPDCPKGHKRVPEEERRKVLEKLKKCKFNEQNGFQSYRGLYLQFYNTLLRCI